MAVRQVRNNAYGISDPLIDVFPAPIVSNEAPKASDKAQLGTLWIKTDTNDVYIITSIVNNEATWMSPAGGTGIFDALEATSGNITADVGNIIATVGDISAPDGTVSGSVVSSATTIAAGETITAGTGLTVTTGAIETENGDLILNDTADASAGVIVDIQKSRLGGAITTGDIIGSINFRGNDGATFVDSAAIVAQSTGTIDTDRVASNIQFFTHPDAATDAAERMRIAETGVVTINEPDAAANNLVLASTTAAKIIADDGVTANISLYLNAKGTGQVGQTRSEAGTSVNLINNNSDNTNGASNALVQSAVGGTSGGDAYFSSLISGGQVYSWGIDNSTANDDLVISKNAALGTGNVLSFDGTSDAATFAAGVTATTGDITSTAGDLVASTAGKGVILGGGASVVCGTGDPNTSVTAAKGSLYLRLDGSGVGDRAYINTDGATAWAAITTVS